MPVVVVVVLLLLLLLLHITCPPAVIHILRHQPPSMPVPKGKQVARQKQHHLRPLPHGSIHHQCTQQPRPLAARPDAQRGSHDAQQHNRRATLARQHPQMRPVQRHGLGPVRAPVKRVEHVVQQEGEPVVEHRDETAASRSRVRCLRRWVEERPELGEDGLGREEALFCRGPVFAAAAVRMAADKEEGEEGECDSWEEDAEAVLDGVG
ncbi:hypothetical protein BD289DRAFT_438906 [Coniella lustricola]|uniref:Secreted protein n=1 Tax=Coniella lustricola TaxID=2025994 RepID=A0A2T3A293_9PEZI|nr:hypothetical protein BD289DRAFT_438906 [Coniella lustricola]